jgi:N-acetylglucosaminyl-diphospho-decaprenol L-rhamnosyltransferase
VTQPRAERFPEELRRERDAGSLPEVARRVDAVVVNYNAREELLECVQSLRAEGVSDITVVDNGSVDGSGASLAGADPEARLVETGANLGYGGGANRGLSQGQRELVLVCNADVVVRAGTLAALTTALDADAGLGLVGPRLINSDGTLYPSARTFPSLVDAIGHGFLGLVAPRNRFSRSYKMLDWDHAGRRGVDWVSGSCFLARRRALEDLGGFDESYFMYLEDVDLCWRLGRAGWRVAYEPSGCVLHVQGVSTDQHPYRMIVAHHESLLRFAWRTTTGWRRLLLPVVTLGLVVRALGASAQRAAGRPRPPR